MRESAAVWAGHISDDDTAWRAEDVIFYRDICDDRAGPLSLELPEIAKFALYESLAAQRWRLVALLHTHPEAWVGLSGIDQRNQLSSRLGFWSLVIPYYATRPSDDAQIGVHVRCRHGWHQVTGQALASRFRVE